MREKGAQEWKGGPWKERKEDSLHIKWTRNEAGYVASRAG